MKAILEFDLDNPDDERNHKLCINASNMSIVLFEMVWNEKKNMIHHFEASNEKHTAFDGIEYFHERFIELLSTYKLNVDDL